MDEDRLRSRVWLRSVFSLLDLNPTDLGYCIVGNDETVEVHGGSDEPPVRLRRE
jgi:hypothetical protein